MILSPSGAIILEFAADKDGGYKTSQPSWYNEKRKENKLDARETLNVGEHPVDLSNTVLLGQSPSAKI